MPIYEYQCSNCGHAFEKLVTTSSDRPKACPKCGGRKLDKQFSTFSASAESSSEPSCASGSCPTPSACAGGTCPFSNS